jgi:ATP-dependent exoDNAse (exonuclease V) alpha subunit
LLQDKVMQIENDYDKEVYNGDIGYIDRVDPDAGEIVVSFDGRTGGLNATRHFRGVPSRPVGPSQRR